MIADSVKVSVFGKISDKLYSAQITSVSGRCKSAYVVSHKPVTEYFEGVVVAVAEFDGLDGERPIISQYGEVFYEPELRQVLSKLKNIKLKSIVCLYEKSCGAVIFYKSNIINTQGKKSCSIFLSPYSSLALSANPEKHTAIAQMNLGRSAFSTPSA
jgi:hypothetical protein